jgi:hypothetical protein
LWTRLPLRVPSLVTSPPFIMIFISPLCLLPPPPPDLCYDHYNCYACYRLCNILPKSHFHFLLHYSFPYVLSPLFLESCFIIPLSSSPFLSPFLQSSLSSQYLPIMYKKLHCSWLLFAEELPPSCPLDAPCCVLRSSLSFGLSCP